MRDGECKKVLALVAICVATLCCLPPTHAGEADPLEFTQIERGRYLSILSDCGSCHTVPGAEKPFAGGRAIETPFGSIIAPNITPDMETGIGAWSDDQFDAAVRHGVGRYGEQLYPAMPYNAYTMMSREDVLAIRAYLNSIDAVRNETTRNTLPFPFNIRVAMRIWNALYFKDGVFTDDPEKPAQLNRGAFLVDGPAHCGACHTPKTALGGDKAAQYLQGSVLQGWFAPNITNDDSKGLGRWSTSDVVAYLKSGHNRFSAAMGPMAEDVSLSTAHMTDDDLQAIASYLKSVPGDKAPPQKAIQMSDGAMQVGEAIYRDQCSSCHGIEGRGVPKLFPDLSQSALARSGDATTIIRIVLRGVRSVATKAEPTAPGMPSYAWQLNDTQIAAVLTYLRNSWGNSADAVAVSQVSKLRAELAKRSD